ncbi:MAG TPA: YceH family protein [Pyrinomonadaceae bacterium]|nr:YceH family protein [Pyrinomonadaceae bacterium]
MPEILSETEARILGSLIEKQLTTPEYYPQTLNALTNACNQKSNRDPVVSYTEGTVSDTVERLRDRNLVYVFYGSTSRVPKYKHMVPSVYELDPSETAVMCELMLRGPQTLGELRGRTERLHSFSGLGEVQETIDGLVRRDDPLVVKLPVQPGQKEARFAHLLYGNIDLDALAASAAAPRSHAGADAGRMEKLEEEVTNLRSDIQALKQMFEEFRKQFE